jgi:hypothetical protein
VLPETPGGSPAGTQLTVADAAKREAVTVETPDWRPTVESIVANAQAACEESRRHIMAQSQDANAVDSKAAALIPIASGLFALLVTHVRIESPGNFVSSVLTLSYFGIGLACCFQAIRPRDGFSYGAYPAVLATYVGTHPNWSLLQGLATALGEADHNNRTFLGAKTR